MLSIVTLNSFNSVPEPIRYTGLAARSKHFAQAFYSSLGENIDVICFQELTWKRNDILENFTKHKYYTPVMKSSLFGGNVRFTESGLCVLSKYPIDSIHATIFDGPTYHVERLCAKGALLVRLFIPFIGYVNIVNTHLNAWTGPKADRARIHQINQIVEWIATIDINTNEPLFFAGDFNVDIYEHCNVMMELMQKLDARLPLPFSTSFSFDPATNPLVGLDAPLEYATLSRKGGCADEYLTLGTCACCPRQLVDLIAISNHHLQPTDVKVEVVPVIYPEKFNIKVKMGVERSVQHVSDHSAVVMKVKFKINNDSQTEDVQKMDKVEKVEKIDKVEKVEKVEDVAITPITRKHCDFILYDKPRFDWKWFLAQILLTIFYVLMILLLLYCTGFLKNK